MAHKTLIDGTAYEIDGGKAMVDGTVYEIDHGTTIVDGTAYEVGFAQPVPVDVIIPDGSGRYVQIDGATYADRITTSGTYEAFENITVCVAARVQDNTIRKAFIYLNGVIVGTSTGTDPTNIKAIVYMLQVEGYSKITVEYKLESYAYHCYITAVPEGHAVVNITGSGSIRIVGKICAVTVDGVDYASATTLAVPVGTVASCTVSTMSTYELDKGWVKINGNTVLTASGFDETYDYTVSGDVTINMSTERNSDKDVNGYITITET